MVTLCPIVYKREDPQTDLIQIAENSAYDDALILFNDNFFDRNFNKPGANTAQLRPRVFDVPCRVVGISTGWSVRDGGFKKLGEEEKKIITAAFERVNTVLHSNKKLRRVVYSCNPQNLHELGFSIFKPTLEAVQFINHKLVEIPNRYAIGLPISFVALDIVEELATSKREFRKPKINKYEYESWNDHICARHPAKKQKYFQNE